VIEEREPELVVQIKAHGAEEPIPVLAAVVERDGRYLVCRRPARKRHGGLWEFPGGKLNPGETIAEGLAREILEELGVAARQTGAPLLEVADPGSPYLIVFVPTALEGEPTCIEHDELLWATRGELDELALAPGDRRFIQVILAGIPRTGA
jgi:8-oxo-dGTP diphosphatase